MTKFIIGFGKCSKYLLFILGTVVFKTLNNFTFENQISLKSEGGIFGFVPVLSNHIFIQYFYKYISYAIGGYIFYYVLYKKSMKGKININKDIIIKKSNYRESILIYNERTSNFSNGNKEILIACSSYCISYELLGILYFFKFDRTEIWTLEIIFVLYFMKKFFVINLYNHTKLAIIILLVPTTILLIISNFLPYTNHKTAEEKSEDLDAFEEIERITGHKLYYIPIAIVMLITNIFLSYSRVKSKVLMDLMYLSPYAIIFLIGIFGSILLFIMLIIISIFKCSDAISEFCFVEDSDNPNNLYMDNVIIYFKALKESGSKMFIEIFLIIPLFLILKFFEFTCEIFVIYYFNPNYVLVRDNIYYIFIRLIFVLVNKEDYQDSISLNQFIILELSEFLSILAYGIYLEIIELRFAGLDRYLKRNIIKRAECEDNLKSLDIFDDFNDNRLNDNMLYDDENENNISSLEINF